MGILISDCLDQDCTYSVLGCFILTATYVLSFYVWDINRDRNHPSTVKKRFLSVLFMSIISPLFVILSHWVSPPKHTVFELMGLRIAGVFIACTVPLLLTMILFLGPIIIKYQHYNWSQFLDPMNWLNNFTNLVWLRDYIVAPLSEELTFRSCMLPLLVQCFRSQTAVLISPLFFGLAHFHHIFDHLKSGNTIRNALIITGVQVCYTTLFGAYSALLFLRTGHFLAPCIVHSFCNYLGFPNIPKLISYEEPKRTIMIGVCLTGLISWCVLLFPLTNPAWYENDIYWRTESL